MRIRIARTIPLALMMAAAPALAQTTDQAVDGANAQTSADAAANTEGTAVAAGETSSGTVAQWIADSPNHSTLAQALTAADLSGTLGNGGAYTVFAPGNTAFQALPAGTVEGLLQPQNKSTLAQILTFHVVPQRVSFADIQAAMEAGGGTATYTTVNGQPISITREGDALRVSGQGGSAGFVGRYDLTASNGIVHSINGVLVPNIQAPPAATPAQPGTAATTPAPTPGG